MGLGLFVNERAAQLHVVPVAGRVFCTAAVSRKKAGAKPADAPGQLLAVKLARPGLNRGPHGRREKSSVPVPSGVLADLVSERTLDNR